MHSSSLILGGSGAERQRDVHQITSSHSDSEGLSCLQSEGPLGLEWR